MTRCRLLRGRSGAALTSGGAARPLVSRHLHTFPQIVSPVCRNARRREPLSAGAARQLGPRGTRTDTKPGSVRNPENTSGAPERADLRLFILLRTRSSI